MSGFSRYLKKTVLEALVEEGLLEKRHNTSYEEDTVAVQRWQKKQAKVAIDPKAAQHMGSTLMKPPPQKVVREWFWKLKEKARVEMEASMRKESTDNESRVG